MARIAVGSPVTQSPANFLGTGGLMGRLLLFLTCSLMISGCAAKPGGDLPAGRETEYPPGYLLPTSPINHRLVAWVNDEPLVVYDAQYKGGTYSVEYMAHRGRNVLRFTADRLPGRSGPTSLQLARGSFLSPEVILKWEANEDHAASPTWIINCPEDQIPSLDEYDDMGEVNDEARQAVADFLGRLKAALENKNLALAGWSEADWDAAMQGGGRDVSITRDVYGAEGYTVMVKGLDDLQFVAGKKTLFVYAKDHGKISYAGRDPKLPRENDKMYYSFGMDWLHFMKKGGNFQYLWPTAGKR
jgi:hypothetical protein